MSLLLSLLSNSTPANQKYNMAYTKGYRGYGNFRRRYSTYSRSLTGVKRSNIPTKLTRSEVSKIAKKEVQKQAELKYFDNSYTSSLTQGAWYVQNLFSGLTQNVTSQGHIGRKITLKGLQFRIRMSTAASPSAGMVRVMVFKTSQQLTTSVSAAVLNGDMFRTNDTLFNVTAMPDRDSITVLWDQTKVINPQTTSTTAGDGDVAFFNFYVPHKRVVHFLAESDSYAKEDNYYVFFAMGRENGSLTTAGFTQLAWEVQYWDD